MIQRIKNILRILGYNDGHGQKIKLIIKNNKLASDLFDKFT